MNIFITGANGFLGGSLARYLCKNHRVRGSMRSLDGGQADQNFVKMDLRDSFQGNFFEGQDVVIHCAHDFSSQSYEINLRGTKQLFHMAREAGVAKQIFISSFSALPNAVSVYGKTKYALESYFLEQMETVVRPGLVIGMGGMFARTARFVLKSPVVPLIDGGRDPVPILAIADFISAIDEIMKSDKREFNLFHPQLVPMRELLQELLKISKRRSLFINVPSLIAIRVLDSLQALGFSLPANGDNIKGLKLNCSASFVSDLLQLVPEPQKLSQMLTASEL